ncbi:protein sprouty homolog 2 [Chanos chanos]|uniref:Protein sprouty homolog 2 n=1 Tax=Chanos chanos TaxID=29144 RepID=A0A6J2VUJ9_CHACN|nr:protein sprouty homolog 2 [Chanos chanos]
MDTRAQNGGSGSSGLLRALRDSGSGRPHAGEPETREAHVLSLVEIRTVRSSNEYTEGPTAVPRTPAPQRETEELVVAGTANEQLLRHSPRVPARAEQQHAAPQPAHSSRDTANRSFSATSEGSRSSGRVSVESNSSEQRLLGAAGGGSGTGERIVRVQPKRAELKPEKPKPLTVAERGDEAGKHSRRCEECGRCKCEKCTCPRALPSCWVCGRRCVCSAQTAVDYGTCVCCVKCLFYHCSSDDEDVCADKPFSCSQSHCCVRWATTSIIVFFLPCLLCYLPAKGCVTLCQACYDRAKRPGCRCKNTNVVRCKNVEQPLKGECDI